MVKADIIRQIREMPVRVLGSLQTAGGVTRVLFIVHLGKDIRIWPVRRNSNSVEVLAEIASLSGVHLVLDMNSRGVNKKILVILQRVFYVLKKRNRTFATVMGGIYTLHIDGRTLVYDPLANTFVDVVRTEEVIPASN